MAALDLSTLPLRQRRATAGALAVAASSTCPTNELHAWIAGAFLHDVCALLRLPPDEARALEPLLGAPPTSFARAGGHVSVDATARRPAVMEPLLPLAPCPFTDEMCGGGGDTRVAPRDVLVGVAAGYIAAGRYDARARACLWRAARAWGVPPSELGAAEDAVLAQLAVAAVAAALAAQAGGGSAASPASGSGGGGGGVGATAPPGGAFAAGGSSGGAPSTSAGSYRWLKVGAATLAGATLLLATGGLAAIPLAAATAAVGTAIGVGAATSVAVSFITSAAGGALLWTILGTAGGGLAAYKVARKTAGVSGFQFISLSSADAGEAPAEALAQDAAAGAGASGAATPASLGTAVTSPDAQRRAPAGGTRYLPTTLNPFAWGRKRAHKPAPAPVTVSADGLVLDTAGEVDGGAVRSLPPAVELRAAGGAGTSATQPLHVTAHRAAEDDDDDDGGIIDDADAPDTEPDAAATDAADVVGSPRVLGGRPAEQWVDVLSLRGGAADGVVVGVSGELAAAGSPAVALASADGTGAARLGFHVFIAVAGTVDDGHAAAAIASARASARSAQSPSAAAPTTPLPTLQSSASFARAQLDSLFVRPWGGYAHAGATRGRAVSAAEPTSVELDGSGVFSPAVEAVAPHVEAGDGEESDVDGYCDDVGDDGVAIVHTHGAVGGVSLELQELATHPASVPEDQAGASEVAVVALAPDATPTAMDTLPGDASSSSSSLPGGTPLLRGKAASSRADPRTRRFGRTASGHAICPGGRHPGHSPAGWLRDAAPYGDVFALAYDPDVAARLSRYTTAFVSTALTNQAMSALLKTTLLAPLLAAWAIPSLVLTSLSMLDSPWAMGVDRADKAAEALADALLSGAHGRRPVTLVGWGLGARVIFKACELLAAAHEAAAATAAAAAAREAKRRGGRRPAGEHEAARGADAAEKRASLSAWTEWPEGAPPRDGSAPEPPRLAAPPAGPLHAGAIVHDVLLFGLPAPITPRRWSAVRRVVSGRLVNAYCPSDYVLRFLYRSSSLHLSIAGLGPVDGGTGGVAADTHPDPGSSPADTPAAVTPVGTSPAAAGAGVPAGELPASPPGAVGRVTWWCGVESVDVGGLVRGHLHYGAVMDELLNAVRFGE